MTLARITQLMGATMVALCAAASLAQEAKPASPSPEKQPETKPAQPTLDDLLGIEKESVKADKPGAPVDDPTRTELERKLSMEEAQEQFKQAVELMGETATRIKDGRDTGLATQRLQEDIIRKLDMIITAAEKQQQQRSKSRQQRQQQQQQDQPGPTKQQQNQGQQHGNEAAPDSMDPPGRQDGDLRPGTAARGAMWGSLPERVRQALSQGDADKYSSLYRKWTEAYYKKLAEEANK